MQVIKNVRMSSQKRERVIAKDISGRAHVLSGGAWNKKGDVSNETFLIEDKFTQNTKYVIQDTILKKLLHQARDVNKIPVLCFGFMLNGKRVDFAVMREKDIQYSTKNIVVIPNTKKSLSLSVDYLENLYRDSLGRVFCHITMESGCYVIMLWDDFIENMSTIKEGGIVG
jgi:hypothetical protein